MPTETDNKPVIFYFEHSNEQQVQSSESEIEEERESYGMFPNFYYDRQLHYFVPVYGDRTKTILRYAREFDRYGEYLKTLPKSYKVFNNKVVVVTFFDNTTEKAVCGDEDVFSVETGLSICILKRLMGGSGKYNRIIRNLIKRHDNAEAAKQKVKAEEDAKKKSDEKRREKKARKKRERRISELTEAIVRAKKETE